MLASLASVVAAGLNILSLKYLKDIVELPVDRVLYMFIVTALVFAAALITLIAGRFITRFFELKLASYREELATRILSARFEKIREKTHRLVPVLLFEIDIVGGFGKVIPEFIVASVQIIVVMSYLIYLSWQLSVIVLGLFLLVILIMVFVLPLQKRLESELSKTRFSLHVALSVMEKGFKDLVMSREHSRAYIQQSLAPSSHKTALLNAKIFTIRTGVELLINALIIVGFGVSLVLYLTWIQIDQAELIQFTALLFFIVPSFAKSISFFNQVKKVENALDQIDELDVDIRSTETTSSEEVSLPPRQGKVLISLEDVTYQYNSSEDGFRLGPLSLDIVENEVTLIKGGNGSGKSTLFMLLAGLYTSKQGVFKFHGNSLSETNIRSFRDLVSCYFTDSPIFDNLSYVNSDITQEKSERFIAELELRGKTELDATTIANTNLSHGQRGRLNLLRLLLEDREIFMLDEWAANQDIHFKEKFYNEIIPNLKKQGKTVILISHDDKFYDIADQIVTLRNGMLESVKR